ncbi:MAG TPA: hypothetical protein VGE67_18790 [Haloferula sp.]
MKTPILIISHVAAVLLGLLLFRSIQPAAPASNTSSQAAAAEAPAPPQETAIDSPAGSNKIKVRTEQASKASVHLSAWKALASEGLTRPERLKASRLLLQQWIKEDWRSALDMVMKETPDDFELLEEFHIAFSREPEAVWQMIEQKRYGVLSQSLFDPWRSSLVNLDEPTVRKLAEGLPERAKQAALETLKWAKGNEPYSGGG